MKNAIGLMTGIVIAGSIMAKTPVLGVPLNRNDWDNDIPGFVQGKMYFSAGIGALNLNYTIASKLKNSIAPNWNHITIEKKNTWFLKAEYAITPHLGAGLDFAFGGLAVNVKMDSVINNIPISGTLTYRTWSALARINYHIISENNFDLYIGGGLGFRANNLKVTDNDPIVNRWNFPVNLGFITRKIPNSLSVPTVGADFTVGMRYHILPPVAIYGEFGLAKSFLQAGVTIRI